MANKITEIKARIYDVNSIDLVVFESLVNQETTKLAPTRSGAIKNRATKVYHQCRYSFMN